MGAVRPAPGRELSPGPAPIDRALGKPLGAQRGDSPRPFVTSLVPELRGGACTAGDQQRESAWIESWRLSHPAYNG